MAVVFEGPGALSWRAVELRRRGRTVGDQRAAFWRHRERYNSERAEGAIDRRRGGPVTGTAFVVEQYRTRYRDFKTSR
jgi:hypothetical protein